MPHSEQYPLVSGPRTARTLLGLPCGRPAGGCIRTPHDGVRIHKLMLLPTTAYLSTSGFLVGRTGRCDSDSIRYGLRSSPQFLRFGTMLRRGRRHPAPPPQPLASNQAATMPGAPGAGRANALGHWMEALLPIPKLYLHGTRFAACSRYAPKCQDPCSRPRAYFRRQLLHHRHAPAFIRFRTVSRSDARKPK